MDASNLQYALDTFFLIFSAVLIIFMMPCFSMLEAGLVRTKNVTVVLTGNTLLYAVCSFIYLIWGYNLMFKGSGFFLDGVHVERYSKYAIFFFQMAFVSKTISIMSGGVSERIKILPFMTFAVVMSGFIYPLVGSWTWGGGFLKDMHDLAGSTVIHSVGGWALLAAILVWGLEKENTQKRAKSNQFQHQTYL